MERRQEPRHACNQPARLIDLTTGEALEAAIVNVSGRGMQIRVGKRIPLSTPVRVDQGDLLLLGDVCYCRDDGSSALCGVKLAHSFTGTAATVNLVKQLEAAQLRPGVSAESA